MFLTDPKFEFMEGSLASARVETLHSAGRLHLIVRLVAVARHTIHE